MNPIVTVGAIIEKYDKILLVKRNTEPFKGRWALPGGHVDFGETAEQAIIRETKKETGLEFKQLKFFKYYDEINPERAWHAIVLVFTGIVKGKVKRKKINEIANVKWFPINKVDNMKLAFNHNIILLDWVNFKNR